MSVSSTEATRLKSHFFIKEDTEDTQHARLSPFIREGRIDRIVYTVVV